VRSGADRDRTGDIRIANAALSQLSYGPACHGKALLAVRIVWIGRRLEAVGQGRVELPTSRLSGVRSNHLSYWPDGGEDCFPLSGEGLAPSKLNRTHLVTMKVGS
jgi:hypothetical protein